jgi:hypothetical protein
VGNFDDREWGISGILVNIPQRAFVLDVASDAEPGIHQLLLVYGREWEEAPIRSFELLIAIVAPMSGVQLTQDQLAVAH